MEFNVVNGKVDFILISGNSRIKSSMLEKEAKELVETGQVKRKGNLIIVNDKFIFGEEEPEAVKVEVKKEVKEEPKVEVEEEVKEEPKKRNNKRKETKGKTNPRKIKSKRDK